MRVCLPAPNSLIRQGIHSPFVSLEAHRHDLHFYYSWYGARTTTGGQGEGNVSEDAFAFAFRQLIWPYFAHLLRYKLARSLHQKMRSVDLHNNSIHVDRFEPPPVYREPKIRRNTESPGRPAKTLQVQRGGLALSRFCTGSGSPALVP